MDSTILQTKLASLPDHLKQEVADFIDVLTTRVKTNEEIKKPRFGSGKGMFVIAPDFDEPLEDFNEYMSR